MGGIPEESSHCSPNRQKEDVVRVRSEGTVTGNLCGVISVPEQDAGKRRVKAKGSLASQYKMLSGLIGF